MVSKLGGLPLYWGCNPLNYTVTAKLICVASMYSYQTLEK